MGVLKTVNEQKSKFDIQIIVSDDCSSDKTISILKENSHLYDKILISDVNKGKGHAIKQAIPHLKGDITLIQDADLEITLKNTKFFLNHSK